MASKEVIIIGAGYAGVHAAKKLAKKYKNADNIAVTLIDRHPHHTLLTELHEVAGHRVESDAVQLDLKRLFNRTKVKLVTDNVTHVDPNKKLITTDHAEFHYDYLVLGMGAEPNDFGTPGVEENGFTLWSLEDAVKLRHHIENTVRAASTLHDKEERRAMLTFIVCGSGFTGIEMVGELMEWKDGLARDNNLESDEIRLYVVEAAPTILNMLERRDADKAEKYLLEKGVKIIKGEPIVEVKEEYVVLKSGGKIPTHTLIWTAGVKANSDTESFGLTLGHNGRIRANQYMESEDFEDIYIIGDLVHYEEEPGKLTPQIVEAAEQTGMTAAKNIISKISGGEKVAYNGKYHGVMVSIGSRYGVANLSGIHLSGWLAIFMKHMVNLYYLFGLRSGFYMWQYVKHEFFQTKDKRNIFRNTLNRYGNALWSIPLRLYLGFFWLSEAFGKFFGKEKWEAVVSGSANVSSLFTGLDENSWLVGSTVRMPFEWLQTPSSGATPVVEGGSSLILSSMPGFFQWFMRIVLPTPEMAVFMQKFMVFVELALGLALLLGFFTWIASLMSAGFLIMFTLSAMLGWDKFWALPASIALMNGSGRTLGLDYWIIPILKNKISHWWYGKKVSVHFERE